MKKYIFIFTIFFLVGFFLINFKIQAEVIFSNIGVGATADGGITVTDPTVFNLDTSISTRYLRIDARNDGSQMSSNYIELRAVKAWVGESTTNVLKSIYSGGNARVVEHSVYNGAGLYNSDLSIDCSGSWNPQGSLCDEGITADSKDVSSKSSYNSGATWNISGADDTGVLVVDMGSVQNLTELRVFQMFSDGKTTQIHFTYHPETGDTPPDWNDIGWLNFDGTLFYVKTFSGEGFGSSLSPYQITTCDQLQEMNEDLDAHYVLNNNINCSQTSTWNSDAGFIPIGNSSTPFTGIFNGANFEISNLIINRPTTSYIGLFGLTNSPASISNVSLKNLNITGKNGVGGLIGGNNYSGLAVTNSHVSGSVTGRYYVGGLIGMNRGTITNSSSATTVTGGGDAQAYSAIGMVGGLVGRNGGGGTITNSYASGNVIGNNSYENAGGLVGANLDWSGSITNSYALGNVSATNYVGGLVGNSNGSGSITDSNAKGTVTGNDYVGGLLGSLYSSGSIYSSYATGNVVGHDNVGGLVGYNEGGHIEDTYATGDVTGNISGGLVGKSFDKTIVNSYATGNVTGSIAGGLIGHLEGDFVYNSYSTSKIISSTDESLIETYGQNHIAGGLIGLMLYQEGDSVGTYVFNCGWYKSADNSNLSGIGLSGINSSGDYASADVSYAETNNNVFYSKDHGIYKNSVEYTWDFSGDPWYEYTNDYPKFTQQTIFPDPTCSDGILNQNETGIDSGGVCTPVIFPDPTCSDGILNQNETGIDSGGVCTPVRRQGGRGFILYNQRINITPAVVPITPTTPTVSEKKFIFTKNLNKGMIDNEVKELQKFLNAHGFIISPIGVGSSGFETIKFGSLTQKALIRFQLANKIKPALGYFGPITRGVVNEMK